MLPENTISSYEGIVKITEITAIDITPDEKKFSFNFHSLNRNKLNAKERADDANCCDSKKN